MEIQLMSNYTFDNYLESFHLFLEQKKLRKTYERNLIAQTIYESQSHFTFLSLMEKLHHQKHYISKATLYKTLTMLINAGLVNKHNFSVNAKPQYEKVYIGNHNHIYMEETSKIIEFSDSRIEEIIKSIEKEYGVVSTRHSFIIYCNAKKEN